MITLTPEFAKRNNEDPNSRLTLPETEGVLVVEVVPNTPADRAGLEQGDVILQVAGQRVEDAEQLQDLVEKSGVSETITFKIQRGDRELEVEVTTAQLETSS
jgi:S1-C subfamily serine protease